MTQEEYDQLWDENIQLRDALADARLLAMDAANALSVCHELFGRLALRDERKDERIIRKGFTAAFSMAERRLAKILEFAEDGEKPKDSLQQICEDEKKAQALERALEIQAEMEATGND